MTDKGIRLEVVRGMGNKMYTMSQFSGNRRRGQAIFRRDGVHTHLAASAGACQMHLMIRMWARRKPPSSNIQVTMGTGKYDEEVIHSPARRAFMIETRKAWRALRKWNANI